MANSIKCEGQNDVLFRKMSIDLKSYSKDSAIFVPDTHNAIIIKDGIALQTLPSGKHKIFQKDPSLFKEEHVYDVIFVSKTAKLNIKWGTNDRFNMRDPVNGTSILLGASGELEVQISNPRKAYLELIGQNISFSADDLKDRLQGRLLAEVQFRIANIMKEKNLSYDRLCEVLLPTSNEIYPHIANMFEKDYGLKVFSFTISRVLIDEKEVEKIDQDKAKHAQIELDKAKAANQERLDDKLFQRELELKRLEKDDYAKYLELCRQIGWPQNKKETKAEECPNCGVKLQDNAKFCPVCGTPIKITKMKCPHCGKAVTKEDMFCKHCGAALKGN